LPGPGPVADRRPNQLFGEIRVFENDMIANYHAVSFILRQRTTRGLQATAHYTWSRTRDQTDNSNNNDGRATQDPYNPMADYGPAYWDVPHRFVASYVYELPFFKQSEHIGNAALVYRKSSVEGQLSLEQLRELGFGPRNW